MGCSGDITLHERGGPDANVDVKRGGSATFTILPSRRWVHCCFFVPLTGLEWCEPCVRHGAPVSSVWEVEMGLFDDAVPGGSIAKPVKVALGALLVGKLISGGGA